MQWAEDLRSDSVPGNAMVAMRHLRYARGYSVDWLESTLLSEDRQQRLFVAEILRARNFDATLPMLEACFDTLRHDRDDLGGQHLLLLPSAALYLEKHVERVRPWLQAALSSADGQVRFYAAMILARTAEEAFLPEVCGELVAHLRDNDIRFDATLAMHGLRALGPKAMAYLTAVWDGGSEQTSTLLRQLELSYLERSPEEEVEFLELQRKDPTGCFECPWPGWISQNVPFGAELAGYWR